MKGNELLFGRDNQRAACYAWERRASIMRPKYRRTPSECDRIIRTVWPHYHPNVPAPKFEHRGRRNANYAWYHHGRHEIVTSSPRHLTAWAILHETAHAIDAIHCIEGGITFVGHGPRFVATLIDLVSYYANYSRDRLLDSVDRFNSDVTRPRRRKLTVGRPILRANR